jgi:hypothetical protein
LLLPPLGAQLLLHALIQPPTVLCALLVLLLHGVLALHVLVPVRAVELRLLRIQHHPGEVVHHRVSVLSPLNTGIALIALFLHFLPLEVGFLAGICKFRHLLRLGSAHKLRLLLSSRGVG